MRLACRRATLANFERLRAAVDRIEATVDELRGIRAAVCHDVHSAHQPVEHDDVNVMCIGAQIVGAWLAIDLIDAFLAAQFSTDEDFRRRVEKLGDLEKSG